MGNNITGISIGTVLADIRGSMCKNAIGDFRGHCFEFTYTPYKIAGFDLDDSGEVSRILCNRGIDPYTGPSERLWESSVEYFPASDYREYLFIEGSLGLYNKARELHDRSTVPLDCTRNDFKSNTSYVGDILCEGGDVITREVYILDVLKQFLNDEDYVKFTIWDSSKNDSNKEKVFNGPYLLTVESFIDIILNRFLKTRDWMPNDFVFTE